ncbi:MAG: hypothetical protein ABH885_07110, partial [Candidatus Omnitrophota bacterium]
VNGAEVDLIGEPDGSFNIENIGKPEAGPGAGAQKGPGIPGFGRAAQGGDWFSRIYNAVKTKKSTAAAPEEKQAPAEKITREIKKLPKDRRVIFETQRGYLMEIKLLSMKNVSIHAEAGGNRTADIENGRVRLAGLVFDPVKGAKFDDLEVRGDLKSQGQAAGSFSISYAQRVKGSGFVVNADVVSKDIDLAAVSFVYDTSLPVNILKGYLSIKSETVIRDGDLNSKNEIVLRDHDMEPKNGNDIIAGVVPMSTLCQALNQVNPAKLNFTITGTLENPKFSGFEDSLMNLVKPYIANLAVQAVDNLKDQGVKSLGKYLSQQVFGASGASAAGDAAASASGDEGEDIGKQAVDALQKLFKK